MRLKTMLTFALVTLLAHSASPAPLGESADLPPMTDWPVEFKGLPKAAPLGGSPAALLSGQAVYSAAKNSPDAKKIAAMIEQGVYSAHSEKRNPHFQWYTLRLMGADAAGFDLENGRLFRIGYFYPRLAKQKGESAIKEFAKLDPKADISPKPDPNAEPHTPPPSPERVVITMNGTRLICEIHRPVGLAGKEPNSPGMIVYEVHKSDWYLLTHKPDENIAEAIRNGDVILGMTEEEAVAAMPDCKIHREASANDRLVWLDFYSTLSDSSLPTAKVYINDGKVHDVQMHHRSDAK